MDRRVVKMVYNNDAHSSIIYTYYSNDASGNPLAVYDRSTIQLLTPSNPRTFSDKYRIAEQTIYGSSRLGSMNPDEQIVNATITQPTATPPTWRRELALRGPELRRWLLTIATGR